MKVRHIVPGTPAGAGQTDACSGNALRRLRARVR